MKMLFKYDRIIDFIEYNDINGKKLDVGTFVNGNGIINIYNEDGTLIKTVEFLNGKRK